MGVNKYKSYFNSSNITDTAGPTYKMDIYFPVKFYSGTTNCTSSLNADEESQASDESDTYDDSSDYDEGDEDWYDADTTKADSSSDTDSFSDSQSNSLLSGQRKYPVLLFLPGGGFNSAKKDGENEQTCDSLAARGFIVATIKYRTDKTHPQCDDANNNYLLVRAVQDARLALRALKAISKGNYNANGKGYVLDMPFLDMTRIFIGGSSAGAVTAVTTAYYDECDINDALNSNNELEDKSLATSLHSTKSITCNGNSVDVPFKIDLAESTNGDDAVTLYFSTTQNTKAAIDAIKGIFNIKGGVPEYGGNYAPPVDTQDPDVLPLYVFNGGDHIPIIEFDGLSDATVPARDNFESNYVIETGANCGTENNKVYDFCLSTICDNCNNGTCHHHVLYNGFLWGPKKIYDKIIDYNIQNSTDFKVQYYGVPGGTHSFETVDGNKWPFIYTQSALFFHNIICDKDAVVSDYDTIMDFSVPSSSIKFDNCTTNNNTNIADFRFNVQNDNVSAVLKTFDYVVEIQQNGTSNIVASSVAQTVNFEKSSNSSGPYILPGETGTFYITGVNLKTQFPFLNNATDHKITITLTKPNGFYYSAYTNPSTNTTYSYQKSSPVPTICASQRLSNENTESIVIYPNPTQNSFYLETNSLGYAINVFDLTGHLIESFTLASYQTSFGERYQPGIYLISLFDSTGNIRFNKIVKTGK